MLIFVKCCVEISSSVPEIDANQGKEDLPISATTAQQQPLVEIERRVMKGRTSNGKLRNYAEEGFPMHEH